MAKKEEKKPGKKQEKHAEKKADKPAAKKQEDKKAAQAEKQAKAEGKFSPAFSKKAEEDIWAEEKLEKKVGAKVEKTEKAAEAKHAHLATAKELLSHGIDSSIIFYPLVTEKAVNMIESQNKLCFIVAERADKPSVKKAIEAMYGAKVDAVNIVRDMKGRKKAIVKINKKFKADEIAMKLGVI